MAMIKSLCITLVICIVGSDGRKRDEFRKRLEILEQKFSVQVNENTLLKAEIDGLKNAKKDIAETISSISVSLDKNENEITKVSTKCDRINSTMETIYSLVLTRITELSEKLDSRKVSFSARLSKSVENLAPGTTLIFEDIISNKGSAYSGQTGIFTAPLSGVYVFYTHILGADRSLEMSLQQNDENKLWLYVNGPGHGGDSNMIVLQLTKGDEIKVVKHGHYGTAPFYVHHVFSTFSGYMIYQT